MRRFLLAAFFLLLIALPAFAQEGDPKEKLTKELWCPICNGIRLDVCEQQVCEQMREMIDVSLDAGKTPEQIKADFIDLYGPEVLGEPPREGFNLVAWIMPVVLLVGGLAIVAYLTLRWTRRPAPAVIPPGPPTPPAAGPTPQDPYLARVERDLGDL
ncbi:MAG: cytochrome c-type biogenesis protein CcmH [Caldilineales bacterium]|nr:cytochrome c-type biogenesis protein CcmH [Caldilineales bacterium]MCW5858410.1 cytochrome c-type biogenesis protein CcmH [Caldilineales bacterium]